MCVPLIRAWEREAKKDKGRTAKEGSKLISPEGQAILPLILFIINPAYRYVQWWRLAHRGATVSVLGQILEAHDSSRVFRLRESPQNTRPPHTAWRSPRRRLLSQDGALQRAPRPAGAPRHRGCALGWRPNSGKISGVRCAASYFGPTAGPCLPTSRPVRRSCPRRQQQRRRRTWSRSMRSVWPTASPR